MISWNHFILFAIASVLCWATGAWGAWKEKRKLAFAATGVGLAIFFTYIVLMWISLERPPLRTMGETRLWYSFFLPLAGIIVYSRWRYKWILSFSTILSTVFVCINIFKPEIHSKTLMPALQSPWFAPHVIVYMMAYALLGAAVLMSLYLLFFQEKRSHGKRNIHHRRPRVCRTFFHNTRHADGRTLGKRSLGTLLELGSEGDVGGYHLAGLPHLYPLSLVQAAQSATRTLDANHLFLSFADVLVGYQLSPFCPRLERTYVQLTIGATSSLFPKIPYLRPFAG